MNNAKTPWIIITSRTRMMSAKISDKVNGMIKSDTVILESVLLMDIFNVTRIAKDLILFTCSVLI